MNNLGGRFRRGVSVLAQMSASWLNEVGARVSHIIGCQFINVQIPDNVTQSTPIRVGVDFGRLDQALTGLGYAKGGTPTMGTPTDLRDTAAGTADKTAVTWTSGGKNGIRLTAYVLCETQGSASYWYRANLDIAADGRISKVDFDGTYRRL